MTGSLSGDKMDVSEFDGQCRYWGGAQGGGGLQRGLQGSSGGGLH